jgi:hypothetical protein
MWDSGVGNHAKRARVLNAVALQNAVLCAECDVVSDSPNDTCLICGSRSLFNIARVFGGKLPKQRANLIPQANTEVVSRDVVLALPKPHRFRRRGKGGSRLLSAIAIEDDQIDQVERPVLVRPQDR